MPPGEATHIWDIAGPKTSWTKGEYCVHWIIVNGRPTMFTFECLQDRESLCFLLHLVTLLTRMSWHYRYYITIYLREFARLLHGFNLLTQFY